MSTKMSAEDCHQNGASRLTNSDNLPTSTSASPLWQGLAHSTATTCSTGKSEPQHLGGSSTVPYMMLHDTSRPVLAHSLPLTGTTRASFQAFPPSSAMCDVDRYIESPLSSLMTGQCLQTVQVADERVSVAVDAVPTAAITTQLPQMYTQSQAIVSTTDEVRSSVWATLGPNSRHENLYGEAASNSLLSSSSPPTVPHSAESHGMVCTPTEICGTTSTHLETHHGTSSPSINASNSESIWGEAYASPKESMAPVRLHYSLVSSPRVSNMTTYPQTHQIADGCTTIGQSNHMIGAEVRCTVNDPLPSVGTGTSMLAPVIPHHRHVIAENSTSVDASVRQQRLSYSSCPTMQSLVASESNTLNRYIAEDNKKRLVIPSDPQRADDRTDLAVRSSKCDQPKATVSGHGTASSRQWAVSPKRNACPPLYLSGSEDVLEQNTFESEGSAAQQPVTVFRLSQTSSTYDVPTTQQASAVSRLFQNFSSSYGLSMNQQPMTGYRSLTEDQQLLTSENIQQMPPVVSPSFGYHMAPDDHHFNNASKRFCKDRSVIIENKCLAESKPQSYASRVNFDEASDLAGGVADTGSPLLPSPQSLSTEDSELTLPIDPKLFIGKDSLNFSHDARDLLLSDAQLPPDPSNLSVTLDDDLQSGVMGSDQSSGDLTGPISAGDIFAANGIRTSYAGNHISFQTLAHCSSTTDMALAFSSNFLDNSSLSIDINNFSDDDISVNSSNFIDPMDKNSPYKKSSSDLTFSDLLKDDGRKLDDCMAGESQLSKLPLLRPQDISKAVGTGSDGRPESSGEDTKSSVDTSHSGHIGDTRQGPYRARETIRNKELLVQQVSCFKCRVCSFLTLEKTAVQSHMKEMHPQYLSDTDESEVEETPDPTRRVRVFLPRTSSVKSMSGVAGDGDARSVGPRPSCVAGTVQTSVITHAPSQVKQSVGDGSSIIARASASAVGGYNYAGSGRHDGTPSKIISSSAKADSLIKSASPLKPVGSAGQKHPVLEEIELAIKRQRQAHKEATKSGVSRTSVTGYLSNHNARATARLDSGEADKTVKELKNSVKHDGISIGDIMRIDSVPTSPSEAKFTLSARPPVEGSADEPTLAQSCPEFPLPTTASRNGQASATEGGKRAPVAARAGRPVAAKTQGIAKNRKKLANLERTDDILGSRCDVGGCGLRLRSFANLTYHRACHRVDGGPSDLECPECQLAASHWRLLATHLWRQHSIDIDLVKCPKCDFRCYSASRLRHSHLPTHSSNRPFLCETCGSGFKTAKQLLGHKVKVHEKREATDGQNRCEACDKQFTERRMLLNHIEVMHNKVRRHLCCQCGKAFGSKTTLDLHMRTHTGEKPFACSECSYVTSDHNSLRRHRMQHSQNKRYKCAFCPYSAIQSTSYKTHLHDKHRELAYSAGLLFACPHCPFKTLRMDMHRSHLVTKHKLSIEELEKLLPDPGTFVTPAAASDSVTFEVPAPTASYLVDIDSDDPPVLVGLEDEQNNEATADVKQEGIVVYAADDAGGGIVDISDTSAGLQPNNILFTNTTTGDLSGMPLSILDSSGNLINVVFTTPTISATVDGGADALSATIHSLGTSVASSESAAAAATGAASDCSSVPLARQTRTSISMSTGIRQFQGAETLSSVVHPSSAAVGGSALGTVMLGRSVSHTGPDRDSSSQQQPYSIIRTVPAGDGSLSNSRILITTPGLLKEATATKQDERTVLNGINVESSTLARQRTASGAGLPFEKSNRSGGIFLSSNNQPLANLALSNIPRVALNNKPQLQVHSPSSSYAIHLLPGSPTLHGVSLIPGIAKPHGITRSTTRPRGITPIHSSATPRGIGHIPGTVTPRGSSVIPGTATLRGSSLIPGTATLRGSSQIPGTATLRGSNLIQNTTLPRGTSLISIPSTPPGVCLLPSSVNMKTRGIPGAVFISTVNPKSTPGVLKTSSTSVQVTAVDRPPSASPSLRPGTIFSTTGRTIKGSSGEMSVKEEGSL